MRSSIAILFLAFLATLKARLSGRPRSPGWSFRLELTVRSLRMHWDATATYSLQRLRGQMDRRSFPRDCGKNVEFSDVEIAGIPARRCVPRSQLKEGLILFLQGGSSLFGSARTSPFEMMARVAHESGLQVWGPDCRTLPEHPYPAQLHDALAVYRALVQGGTPAHKIVVAGDSSGGNLATELALALRDNGEPMPAALALISPWCDLTMPGRSWVEHDRFDYGTREVLVRYARAFAGDLALSDPRISPSRADLSGLCPCLVVAGEVELSYDDIVAFSDKLKMAGVATQLHVARDMPHDPPAFARFHPEAETALLAVADFAVEQLVEAQDKFVLSSGVNYKMSEVLG